MSFGGNKGKAKATEVTPDGHPPEADSGEGYVMGGGRGGRGRDGAGSYEMVGMAPKEPV